MLPVPLDRTPLLVICSTSANVLLPTTYVPLPTQLLVTALMVLVWKLALNCPLAENTTTRFSARSARNLDFILGFAFRGNWSAAAGCSPSRERGLVRYLFAV